jgi:hypothetical protein
MQGAVTRPRTGPDYDDFPAVRIVLVAMALAGTAASGTATVEAPTFEERGGVVSIEAERPTAIVGPWEEVEGRSAGAANAGSAYDFQLVPAGSRHPLAGAVGSAVTLPRSRLLPWGVPAPTAVSLAVLRHDRRKAAFFVYEEGAPLGHGDPAPARRVFAPLPDAEVPEFGAWLRAGVLWAAEGLAPASRRAFLLALRAEPEPIERILASLLREAGFAVEARAVDAMPLASVPAGSIVLVSPAIRAERVPEALAALASPVVVAGKAESAARLGLTVPPRDLADGANAMLIRTYADPSSYLRYAIRFASAGRFRVWLLGQNNGADEDGPLVSLDRAPGTPGADSVRVRFGEPLQWTPAVATGGSDSELSLTPGFLRVEVPGWHDLFVAKDSEPAEVAGDGRRLRRFPQWRLDKIVLQAPGAADPGDAGPPETRATGSDRRPATDLRPAEARSGPIWRVREGFAVIEAEDLVPHVHWREQRSPSGFTGRSYLEWAGPDRTRSIEGLGGNDDLLNVRQGSREEWLIVRVRADEPGVYRIDVRNHHRREDGDNDLWFGAPGVRGTRENPIRRMGDSLRDGPGFSWLDWGVARLEFRSGVNEFYLGGRSVGFGIDRVAVYREGDTAARDRALDPRTPAFPPE